ncbi:phosphoglycerate dehydrogenase [Weissella soli]|uniref:phosphoglycerate dehydrogenase n=3 Tax=Weissella soli TaxID=155866 RepID=UPI0035A17901
MADKVLLPNDISAAGKELLTAAGLEVIVGSGRERETMMAEGKDAFAVLIGTQKFDGELMDAMPNLKVIARNGVGYDSVDVAAATARGIYVVNTPQALSDSVAETTVAELLAISKNLYADSAALRAGDWKFKRTHPGRDLQGKTVGILGYGRIGQLVAKKLAGFDVKVLVVDPFAKPAAGIEIVDRERLFKEADYITLHLPALPETTHSVGKAEFDLMKDSAFLINLARGAILIEADLVDALVNGKIAGAALDVFENEPLPADSPLLQAPNVLLTPHMASNTVETLTRMAVDAAGGIVAVHHGEKPQWAVNKLA